ncbi:MAG: Holliday junction branch migration protein RuvA [Gemmatimonadetes bacterium]|nr:Holliday junction branch migration protein RuvA [Gemmatimonadota bacterium]
MISRIRGVLLRRAIGVAEVMTQSGVGYEIQIPLTVFERLPPEGTEVELRTYQVVREDSVELFGFLDDAERAVFGRLLTASGVGPRLAVSILSSMSPDRVIRAIIDRDIASLRQIPGLGTKKAERLALELADRMDDIAITAATTRSSAPGFEEAVHALVALGYTSADAASAVRKVVDDQGAMAPIDLIKAALAAIKK